MKRSFSTELQLRFGVLVLLSLGWACAPAEGGPAADGIVNGQKPRNVRIVELTRSDLEEHVALSGRVRAVRSTDVSSEEVGVVETIPHDRGALVEEGGVIMALDRDLLAAEMKAAEATMKLREFNYDRMKSLYDNNSASTEDVLITQTEFEQAAQSYEVARLRFGRAAIKAPFGGIVAERFVEIGQHVVAGQVVARVVDPFSLALEGWITERDVRWTRQGAQALVVLEEGREILHARVHWVGIEADPRNGKFAVELRIPNPNMKLRAGVVARARVLKRAHHDVMVIPRDAVLDTGDGRMVFVEVDGIAQPRPIRLGADEGLMVICESGLAEGDRLVVRGHRDLAPGAPVIVQERSQRRDGWMPRDPDQAREADLLGPIEGADDAQLLGDQP
ncbi:MAG TPA: efflux RND transporter periplasmic adaptor subunit [Candidatus Krumholzibacteria bacterium]|jgi:RND family efflux transporter MFP subunit